MNKNASNQNTNKTNLLKDFDNIVMDCFHETFVDNPNNKEVFVAEVKDYLDDISDKANIEGIEEGMNLLNRFYDFRYIADEAMEGLMHMLMDLLQILIVKVRGHRNVTGQYRFNYC